MKVRFHLAGWVTAVVVAAALTPAVHAQSSGRVRVFVRAGSGPIRIQTTVVIPDGGSATLGSYSQAAESRTEIGTPGLSKVPYVGRLQRNIGSGRSIATTRVIGSARIIDLREEEERQTGYRRR